MPLHRFLLPVANTLAGNNPVQPGAAGIADAGDNTSGPISSGRNVVNFNSPDYPFGGGVPAPLGAGVFSTGGGAVQKIIVGVVVAVAAGLLIASFKGRT